MKARVLVAAGVALAVAGCTSGRPMHRSHQTRTPVTSTTATRVCPPPGGPAPTAVVARTPLEKWIKSIPMYVAHRGGDLDWVEGSAYAYRKAAAWNPQLALEVPVWMTSDGVWVVSEGATTGRVFGTDYDIRATTWATLSRLSTTVGGYPMARLVNDILIPYGSSRILFIDDKADSDVTTLFDLLDSYAGKTRYVVKSFYQARNSPAEAHRRGYLTWGYYYERNMGDFAQTQSRFDLLGLNYSAPASDFAAMRSTGKPVIAHLIATAAQASAALCMGASGLMVAGVQEVVAR